MGWHTGIVKEAGMGTPAVATYRSVLGMILRSRRERAGLSPKQVAESLRWYSGVKVSKIEAGVVKLAEQELLDLLRLYQVEDPDAGRIAEISEKARKRLDTGRAASSGELYQFFIAEAAEIDSYTETVLPEFIQTRDYAKALLATSLVLSPTEIAQRVQERAEAYHFLVNASSPRCHVVLTEAALMLPVGGQRVFDAQLVRLRELIELPTVTLQVIPFRRGEHVAHGTPFTLLRLAVPEFTAVFMDGLVESNYFGDWDNTDIYRLAFQRLTEVALSEQDSIKLLDQKIKQ